MLIMASIEGYWGEATFTIYLSKFVVLKKFFPWLYSAFGEVASVLNFFRNDLKSSKMLDPKNFKNINFGLVK